MARPAPDVARLVAEVSAGHAGAVSRAITLLESTQPAHQAAQQELIAQLLPRTGGAFRIGITGSPGVGKSTFIEAFGLHLLSRDHRLAVLAVDPSSPLSGGSILGDKTRMERLARHPRAFIRPSPAGTVLGGVARASREAIWVCEAAGFDTIVVETVGVGQSETLVRSMVDAFVLLQQPGAGDDLQGIKRGIIELADLIVVTKADPDNAPLLQRARMALADLRLALHLHPTPPSGVPVEVLLCSAPAGHGIAEVWQQLEQFRAQLQASGYWQRQRAGQQLAWFNTALREGVWAQFEQQHRQALAAARRAVAAGQASPSAAVARLLHGPDAAAESKPTQA